MVEKNSIILGCYPQNDESFKKEPIEWIVLKREDHRILCISKFLLDCKPYHETLEEITWEKCTLRKWLNNDFFVAAFIQEEQNRILTTPIENSFHDTKDRIFILSCDEAEESLDFDERASKTTEYARKQGAWFVAEKEDHYVNHGSWWLRYPEWLEEENEHYTVLSCVNFDGTIEGAAEEVNGTECCIRPVFWLKSE
jgi:hypothetical protein